MEQCDGFILTNRNDCSGSFLTSSERKHHFWDCWVSIGRSAEPGCGANWKKIARFETPENLRSVFQNDLAFLGRIGKASLSEFSAIYGLSLKPKLPSRISTKFRRSKWWCRVPCKLQNIFNKPFLRLFFVKQSNFDEIQGNFSAIITTGEMPEETGRCSRQRQTRLNFRKSRS